MLFLFDKVLKTMKPKFIIATIAFSIIVFLVFEDIYAINKGLKGYPLIFNRTAYKQDTPILDSVKRHYKYRKKNKLNKDSIRKYKKDTV